MINIPKGELDEWLSELKTYQRKSIDVFLKSPCTPEEAAEKWLSATGSPNLVAFGGINNPKPFWELFKAEFRKFVCNDDEYVNEKLELVKHGEESRMLLVSTISGALGSTLGLIPSLILPAVVLMIYVVAKVGIKAFCNIN